MNTIDYITAKIDDNINTSIGGLQLHQANKELLEFINKKFRKRPLKRLYAMHSTGDIGIEYFKENLENIYKDGGVGTRITIRKE